MPELKGSKTPKTAANLAEAFAGESPARNKYTYYAAVAKKEGFEQVAAFFLETAENEKEHAKLHFKALGLLGATVDNLKAAAGGEHEEWTCMYPRMAKEAREEGLPEIAAIFEGIAKIEQRHEERYKSLLKSIESGAVFKRAEKTRWVCRNCGHVHEGTEAPKLCPVCKHPQAYFEQEAENF
jgi:rubrerythrin